MNLLFAKLISIDVPGILNSVIPFSEIVAIGLNSTQYSLVIKLSIGRGEKIDTEV